jgi:hypothetical protein
MTQQSMKLRGFALVLLMAIGACNADDANEAAQTGSEDAASEMTTEPPTGENAPVDTDPTPDTGTGGEQQTTDPQ